MQRVALETPTPISAMVCKDGIFNVMDLEASQMVKLPLLGPRPKEPYRYVLVAKQQPQKSGLVPLDLCLGR